MDAEDTVLLSRADGVAVITLNRPSKLNALTHAMRERLLALLREVEADEDVGAAVIAGAGERAFCSGADVDDVRGRTVESELAPESMLRRDVPRFLERMDTPTVAALHGYVLGAGLELALGCTIRVAGDGATFGMPEIRHGVIPGSGGTQRLSRLVGAGWALDLILTERFVDAALAHQIGLVTRVVEPGELMPQACALARRLAELPRFALRSAKAATLRSFTRELDQDIDVERQLFALALHQRDTDRDAAARGTVEG